MARNYIKINRTDSAAVHAGMLLACIGQMRAAFDAAVRVKAIMDNNQDGSVFTDIEALFGLPAGQGQTVYNLINGSAGAMAGTFQNSDCKTLTERVG